MWIRPFIWPGNPASIFATFGDMLRVPGTERVSLQKLRASGADVRVVASPLDIVALAETHAGREVLFMGIGFETTAPAVAAAIDDRRRTKGIRNLSLLLRPQDRPRSDRRPPEGSAPPGGRIYLSGTCEHDYRRRCLSCHPGGRPGRRHNGIRAGRYPGRHPDDHQAMPRREVYGGDPVRARRQTGRKS